MSDDEVFPKPPKLKLGSLWKNEYGFYRIWNGVGWQSVNPVNSDFIEEIIEKCRQRYAKGFADGIVSARQIISGELAEVREFLITLTDDDTSFEKRQRMLNAVCVAISESEGKVTR